MKTLVVFYSRTGVTKKVAEALAAELGADVEELIDAKKRDGLIGWFGAGKDATLKRKAEIRPVARKPADYDLVVVGTPVWAFTMTPAVRAWLGEHASEIRQVAFLCTMGGSGDKRTFEHMQGLVPTCVGIATLALMEKHVRAGTHVAALKDFAKVLRGE
jgi:flavodoxin